MLQFFVNLTPTIITVTLNNAISKHKFAFSLNASVSNNYISCVRGTRKVQRKEERERVACLFVKHRRKQKKREKRKEKG